MAIHLKVRIDDEVGLRSDYLLGIDDAEAIGGQLTTEAIVSVKINDVLGEVEDLKILPFKLCAVTVYCDPESVSTQNTL